MNEPKKSEDILRELAKRAAQAEGELLLKELAEAEAQVPEAHLAHLDRLVLQKRKQQKQRHYRPLAVVAAVLALFLVIRIGILPPEESSTHQEPGPSIATPDEWTFIRLNAPLPDEFTIEHTEQDLDLSIYYLVHEFADDVVLTLRENQDFVENQNLIPFQIAGLEAYGLSTPDFQILQFQTDGIEYVLTCRYEIETLLTIGEKIIKV